MSTLYQSYNDINALKRRKEKSILYSYIKVNSPHLGFFIFYVNFSYDSLNYDAISGSTEGMSRE